MRKELYIQPSVVRLGHPLRQVVGVISNNKGESRGSVLNQLRLDGVAIELHVWFGAQTEWITVMRLVSEDNDCEE